jgi:ABC-type bacteriocin/lantibiotic exporter with double-glycine peptidase domain
VTRPTHILAVPVIGQRTGHECGNTCLAAVVRYFGKPFSPAELATLAGTTSDGTDHAKLVAGAVATGATVFAKERGTLSELAGFIARGLPVIVGWWSMGPGDLAYDRRWTLPEKRRLDCGHFSVIRGTTPDGFLFMDPQDGDDERTIGYCEKSDATFEDVWYDTDTDAYVRVDRWYMVLNYAGHRFADEIGGGEDHPAGR